MSLALITSPLSNNTSTLLTNTLTPNAGAFEVPPFPPAIISFLIIALETASIFKLLTLLKVILFSIILLTLSK